MWVSAVNVCSLPTSPTFIFLSPSGPLLCASVHTGTSIIKFYVHLFLLRERSREMQGQTRKTSRSCVCVEWVSDRYPQSKRRAVLMHERTESTDIATLRHCSLLLIDLFFIIVHLLGAHGMSSVHSSRRRQARPPSYNLLKFLSLTILGHEQNESRCPVDRTFPFCRRALCPLL